MPLPVIRWSIDERDWDNKTASQIASANLRSVRDGDIILLHDVRYATAEASKTIIPELIRRGYQLVTVSEMFEARGIKLKPAGVYRNAYP
jgi:peptidoglycan/xylan/chitin deacetylase (PgdA/CDA1 family)